MNLNGASAALRSWWRLCDAGGVVGTTSHIVKFGTAVEHSDGFSVTVIKERSTEANMSVICRRQTQDWCTQANHDTELLEGLRSMDDYS